MPKRKSPNPIAAADAALAVGTAPAANLSWLMDFVARPTEPTERDLLEVEAFCRRRFAFDVDGARYKAADDFTTSLSVPALAPIRDTLRRNFESLERDSVAVFHAMGDKRLSWTGSCLQPEAWGPPHEVFFECVVFLLLSIPKDRLRVCRAPIRGNESAIGLGDRGMCGRFFVAGRPHQTYCSPTCMNRAGAARFRANNPQKVKRWRHERHTKGQERKLGGQRLKRKT
jgi:hypothetical protein